jgi:hypothetical protein
VARNSQEVRHKAIINNKKDTIMSDSVKKWHEIQEDQRTLSEENIDSIAMQMDLKMWESFSSIVSNTLEYEQAMYITDRDILLIKERVKKYL